MRRCPAYLCVFLLFAWERAGAEHYDWVNRFGGNDSSGYTIGLDGAGNTYVAGYFSGTLSIGTNQLVSAGGWDIFLAKLNPNGTPIWAVGAGGTNDDWVYRIAVTTNGTVFMCGTLSAGATFGTNTLDTQTNGLSDGGGFVARIDDGVLSWIDLFAPENHGAAKSLTLSRKDQTVWVVGENGYQIFVKNYKQDGTIVTNFFVGEPAFVYASSIAASAGGHIFVSGSFYDSLNLGTTNLIGDYYGSQFTAAMDSTGEVLWGWVADRTYPSAGGAIALGPEGSLISVGQVRRAPVGLPYPYAFVAKHSPDGTFQWMQTLGEHRGDYNATDVTVDGNGYILMTGWAAGYSWNPRSRWGVLLVVYKPNGNKLFEHHINSALRADDNRGRGIATDEIGNAVITGWLKGTPMFGTNVMGDGSSGVANTFVARRPTLEPTLDLHRSGTNFTLSWPRPGMPYALQQTVDISSTNWPDVITPPEETNGRKQVALPAEIAKRFFRLKMTNEVPIRHLPHIYDVRLQPYSPFLGRYPVFITASNSIPCPWFEAYASDLDDDALSFEWFDDGRSQQLTNGTFTTSYWPDPEDEPRIWVGRLYDDTLTFPIGTNAISLVAFDGTFRVTNSVRIEVLSIPSAIDELIAAVKASTTNNDALVGPLQAARGDVEHGQFADAIDRLHEFQMRLAETAGLSDADKNLFNAAAGTILSAIQQN